MVGERDRIDKFFGNELIDVLICRGMIEVVVVEIEGAVDVEGVDDVGMKGKLILPLPKAM